MHTLRWPVVLFDLDGTVLDTVELIRASHEHALREVLGVTMTDEELQEMVDRADSNGDAAVTMDDFYNIMTKKTFA